MRLLKRWLLPVLSCLVLAASVWLPQALSLLRDKEVLGAVHTQPMSAVGNLPALPATLAERVLLRGAREGREGRDVQTTQSVGDSDSEITYDTAGRTAVDLLKRSEVLPEGTPFEEAQIYSGYREIHRRGSDGLSASYLILWSRNKQGAYTQLVTDEESGLPLEVNLSAPLGGKYFPAPEETGRRFFAMLGLEAELMQSENELALFYVAAAEGLVYQIYSHAEGLLIFPIGFAEGPDDAAFVRQSATDAGNTTVFVA